MRPIKRAIILCWIMLVACFAIKLFGGNWFEVVCTNEHFSNFCEYVENNIFINQSLSTIVYIVSQTFIVLSVCLIPKPNKKQLAFIIISLFALRMSRYINQNLKSVLEFLYILLIPLLIDLISGVSVKQSLKTKWYLGILGNVFILGFQVVSMITKNVGFKLLNDNLVVTYILLIDYYIMVALYYLYVKLKTEETKNG